MGQVGTVVTPLLSWTLIADIAITLGLFELVPPILVQMTTVHEPCLQLLQFAAHLTPLLGSALILCPLLFSKPTVLGSSLYEARKAVLGLWSCARTSDLASLDRRATVWGWFS